MKHNELRAWTATEIQEYDDARLELAEDGKTKLVRLNDVQEWHY